MLIRLLLCVGEPLYEKGLHQLLGSTPGIEILTGVKSSQELTAECRRLLPDVVILCDQRKSNFELRRVLHAFEAESPAVRVLLLSDPGVISPYQAIRAGASGYLEHDAPSELLIKAVLALAGGEVWAPRATLSRLVRERRGTGCGVDGGDHPLLSDREIEVLKLVAEGLENSAIAEALHVETCTIKSHMVRIFRKLGVRTRENAAQKARDLGELPLGPRIGTVG